MCPNRIEMKDLLKCINYILQKVHEFQSSSVLIINACIYFPLACNFGRDAVFCIFYENRNIYCHYENSGTSPIYTRVRSVKDDVESNRQYWAWSQEQQGHALSAVYWGYGMAHIIGGRLVDKFGGKLVLSFGFLSTIQEDQMKKSV